MTSRAPATRSWRRVSQGGLEASWWERRPGKEALDGSAGRASNSGAASLICRLCDGEAGYAGVDDNGASTTWCEDVLALDGTRRHERKALAGGGLARGIDIA